MSDFKHTYPKILENAEDDIIERMSEKYSPLDEDEVNRIFSKSKSKYNAMKSSAEFADAEEQDEEYINTGMSEWKMYRIRSFFRITEVAAACVLVIGGIMLCLKNLKAPAPTDENEPPVLYSVTALSTSHISESISVTTVGVDFSRSDLSEKKDIKTSLATLSDDLNNTTADTKDHTLTDYKKVNETTITNGSSKTDDEKIVIGDYSAMSSRLSYDEVFRIANNSETRKEFKDSVEAFQPYPDQESTTSYGGEKKYWFNDDGTEGITIQEIDSRLIILYFNNNKSINKRIYIASEIREYENIELKEKQLDCLLIRDRNNLVNRNLQYIPLGKLEDYINYSQDSSSFSEFWQKVMIHSCNSPDRWSRSDPMIFIYYLEGDDGYILVDLNNACATYISENAPDKSMDIISNKGALSEQEKQAAITAVNNEYDFSVSQINE